MTSTCDVLIVGGGLVGCSLACALDAMGLSARVIEAAPARRLERSWDERHFVLTRTSIEALERIGVWQLASREAVSVKAVHVSGVGDFGGVRLLANEFGLEAFGATLPARVLGEALVGRVSALSQVSMGAGRLLGLSPAADAVLATIDSDGVTQTVAARLVVGADGSDSAVRKLVDIDVGRVDYGQTAIVSVLGLGRPHQGIAHERMTATGPFALLPLAGDRAGMVWALPHADAEAHVALGDTAFLAAVQQLFGYKLGRFTRVGRRQPWPLARQTATRLNAHRVVLVGNAAQTIHPVGAQGFNLGLRDAVALATRLAKAGGDPGDQGLLAAHATSRQADREHTIAWTESLLRGFARTGPISRIGRSAALLGLDTQSALKRDLAFGLMGHRDGVDINALPRAAGA